MARRYLHFSVEEWEALPWWQPQMYMEELSKHLKAEAGQRDDAYNRDETLIQGDISDMTDLGVKIESL